MNRRLDAWYVQPKVHHGDFSATLAASLASELRPTLHIINKVRRIKKALIRYSRHKGPQLLKIIFQYRSFGNEAQPSILEAKRKNTKDTTLKESTNFSKTFALNTKGLPNPGNRFFFM